MEKKRAMKKRQRRKEARAWQQESLTNSLDHEKVPPKMSN